MSDYLRKKIAEIIIEEKPDFNDLLDASIAMILGLFLKTYFEEHEMDRLETFDRFIVALREELIEEIARGQTVEEAGDVA